jgi:hypothetical protein
MFPYYRGYVVVVSSFCIKRAVTRAGASLIGGNATRAGASPARTLLRKPFPLCGLMSPLWFLTTKLGNVALPSCRDNGRGGVDVGALCLSSSGGQHCASRNPNESRCHEDKHKAPTLLRIRPLSLQDGGGRSWAIIVFIRVRVRPGPGPVRLIFRLLLLGR